MPEHRTKQVLTCKHRDRVIVETAGGETVEISIYRVRASEIKLKLNSENATIRRDSSESISIDSQSGGRHNEASVDLFEN